MIFGPTEGQGNRGVGKTTTARSSVRITKYYSSDQIKKNEIGRACSMYTGEDRSIQDFGGETGERQICIKESQIKIILDSNKTCDNIWQ